MEQPNHMSFTIFSVARSGRGDGVISVDESEFCMLFCFFVDSGVVVRLARKVS